jgi:hypothetical protein
MPSHSSGGMAADESYEEEEACLLARTRELRALTQSLALDRRPCSDAEHVSLRANSVNTVVD